MNVKHVIKTKNIRLFRNVAGEWVFLVRPKLERFVPRFIPCDVARIGMDIEWRRIG